MAKLHYCNYCSYDVEVLSNGLGALSCAYCGMTVSEEYLEEETTFTKGPGGQSKKEGTFNRLSQHGPNSLLMSFRRGEDQIRMLISSLRIDDTIEHAANCFYKIAAQKGFTRKFKIDYVAAACLYVACRVKKKPYLLIDFSEKLTVSVYVLGAVFLQLSQSLLLDVHDEFRKPVDPSLFIHKFAEGLVAKLDEDTVPKKDVVNRISKAALRFIVSMKRDWIQTGRKPSGICGAALYIASLSNGIRFTKSEVMTVVHVCDATLTKRLTEFGETESGGLTIDEFNQRAEDFEREQFDECTNKSGRTEVLCEHKNWDVHAHGLCKECYDEFFELSGGLYGGADPPSFQRPESEVAQDASRTMNGPSTECSGLDYTLGKESHDKSGQGNNINMTETEKLAEPQFNQNDPVGDKESEDLTNDETESLSDIKDAEVDCYLNSKEEERYKRIIWEQVNKEYLEEQALKEAAKAASYSDMAATDEMQEAQKLARKQKRQQRALDEKNAGPARTAAEAAVGILNKKRLKINQDALKQLFDEDDLELASKKSRKDPENGVSAGGVDASEEQELDNNISIYDERDQDYQEQEDYGPDTYYNNDHDGAYYDGNDEEPYNNNYEDDGDYY
ncbi:hypothetical protein QQ045_003987 [Rhodiola kirilowii]